jgi:hypothetical protein
LAIRSGRSRFAVALKCSPSAYRRQFVPETIFEVPAGSDEVLRVQREQQSPPADVARNAEETQKNRVFMLRLGVSQTLLQVHFPITNAL